MKKIYNVRISLSTYVDVEVEADSKDEAIQLAEQTEYDMGQLLDNLVPDDNVEVTEVEPDVYDMKYFLEKQCGWDWNDFENMSDEQIKQAYDEEIRINNFE